MYGIYHAMVCLSADIEISALAKDVIYFLELLFFKITTSSCMSHSNIWKNVNSFHFQP